MKILATLLLLACTVPGAERRFRIDYAVSIDKIPTLANFIEVWLPVPHDDAYQTISKFNIESDYTYKIQTGDFGNKMLHMRIPRGTLTTLMLDMQFVVKRREHVRILNGATAGEDKYDQDANLQRWLEPDRLVPLDPKIRAWAKEVADAANAHTDLEKARAIYNHVVATIKFDTTGQGWGRGDIYYVYDSHRGNCTDFHAIFIGYARALGIPARFSIGLPLPKERGQGTIPGYHCWAEFYIKGVGWIPVDASEAAKDPARREYFFGAHDENRIEFTRGRDLTLTPRQHGDPLNYFIYPYVEIDGKPFPTVDAKFRYADLSTK